MFFEFRRHRRQGRRGGGVGCEVRDRDVLVVVLFGRAAAAHLVVAVRVEAVRVDAPLVEHGQGWRGVALIFREDALADEPVLECSSDRRVHAGRVPQNLSDVVFLRVHARNR